MKLKSFGCSFIFGSDLPDDTQGIGEPWYPASQLTWPALLAKHHALDYECHARPASGNLRILEKVLSHAQQEPAVFVIGWSWIDRFDYTTDACSFPVHLRHPYDLANKQDLWQTILPVHETQTARSYYKDIHTQFRDKLSTLIHIKTAIDTLNQLEIPFIMTHIDDLIFESEYHTNPAIRYLQDHVRPFITRFEGMTFLEFSKSHGFAISPGMHPLEQAHQAAFELVKSYNLL